MKKRGDANFFIILIILVVIILGIILFNLQNIKDYFTSKELKLSNKDKEYLLNLAYNTIVTYVNEGREYVPENIPNKFLKYNNEVTVSLRSNDIIRGSKLGTGQNLVNNIVNGSIRASQDQRFGGSIKKEELNNLNIIISIVKNEILIQDKTLKNIQKNIELGKDGIRYRLLSYFYFEPIAEVYYTASAPIIGNMKTHEEMLNNLCKKLDRTYKTSLGEDCWKNFFVNIFKLEVIEFKKDFSK